MDRVFSDAGSRARKAIRISDEVAQVLVGGLQGF